MKKPVCRGNLSLTSFLLYLLLSLSAGAQTNIDQLTSSLQRADNDSQALMVYDKIFYHYEYSSTDSGIYYMKRGLSLFTSHKYKKGIAEMLSNLGGIYSSQGMLDVAKETDEEALKIYSEIKSKRGIANAHDILGVIEGRKSNYAGATRHFIIALKIYEDVDDTNAITDTYLKLGTINEKSNNPDKALEYYNKGLSLIKNKPVSDISIFLNNNIGDVYTNKKDYPQALKYLQKALQESAGPGYAQIHILPLENLGDIYSKMGDTDKALSYCQQALAIAEQEHLPDDRALVLITIAGLTRNSDPGKAISQLNDALLTAKTIGEKRIQTEVLTSLISIYKDKGDYKEAYYLLDQQKDISDSILSIDKARTIANLEAVHDLDKMSFKVQQLAVSEQKQKQTKNTIALIAITLTLFLFILIYFLWKTNVLNTILNERELRLEKASLVKNKLISIIAHDLIASIRFMPLALGLCKDGSIPAEEKNKLLTQVELNAIASFETLQNMLDWGKAQIQGITLNQSFFNVNEISAEVLHFVNIAASNKQITVQNNIPNDARVFADTNHFKFIFRNLLSNAIKYTGKNGSIIINVKKTDDASHIIFSIEDNGIGISNADKPGIFESYKDSITGTDNEKGNGIGLNLCKEFVMENGGEIWVESEQSKGSVFYFSLKTGQ